MKVSSYNNFIALAIVILIIPLFLTDCKKSENPIKFPKGIFPDSIINLANINSAYDDYNLALYQLNAWKPILFSSNRRSSGGQFDLEQASLSFIFDQTNGNFELEANMINDIFIDKLITKANTPGNDFGPYNFFSSLDGFEYLLVSSVNDGGNLDLYYLKNRPYFGTNSPDISGPNPVKLLNSSTDDAYICFDSNLDSAYFISNKDGNFDIYLHNRPAEKDIATWFDLEYAASSKVDSINSSGDDKCPFIYRNIMIFTSDRSGGLGGFDLYYSVFRDGNWSSAVNLGPKINSADNEYRPVIGYQPDYKNLYLMFSSDRPGGKGAFDLYFTGIEFPKK